MTPADCAVGGAFCDGLHSRATCYVVGIPFPIYVCYLYDKFCSDMNTVAEWIFRLLFGTFGGSVIIHEGTYCPPTRVERLLQ